MRATYSPEDNKLRIYPDGVRVDSVLSGEEYADFKRLGYRWAAKQECFVCARWTVSAEDAALDLCDEIDDEDYSATERAADRAERFDGYREKREGEALDRADRYDAGGSTFGNQDARRAERAARRADRLRTGAVTQWGKAEYWQSRTAGVIAHALYKARPDVRRGRIKKLEAEQRKHLKHVDEYRTRRNGWLKVAELAQQQDGRMSHVEREDFIGIDRAATCQAAQLAYDLAGSGLCFSEYKHPRTGKAGTMYDLLRDSSADPLTAGEAAALWLSNAPDPDSPGSWSARWTAHYGLRLSYERTMLANEGGAASDADMVVGGFVGGYQIERVYKSNATGRVVSVVVSVPSRTEDGVTVYKQRRMNVERLAEGAYRAPTEADLQAIARRLAERKQIEKQNKKPSPKLVNLTLEDAQRLQDVWNEAGRSKHNSRENARFLAEFVPAEVLVITQKQYSENSGGSYSPFETRAVHVDGRAARAWSNMYTPEGVKYDRSLPEVAFKLRICTRSGGGSYTPPRVIVLSDAKQVPAPLDWDRVAEASSQLTSR